MYWRTMGPYANVPSRICCDVRSNHVSGRFLNPLAKVERHWELYRKSNGSLMMSIRDGSLVVCRMEVMCLWMSDDLKGRDVVVAGAW